MILGGTLPNSFYNAIVTLIPKPDKDANKMNNLGEMDKSLEKYNLPWLNQEEIENMNRPVTSNENESVI